MAGRTKAVRVGLVTEPKPETFGARERREFPDGGVLIHGMADALDRLMVIHDLPWWICPVCHRPGIPSSAKVGACLACAITEKR